MSSVKERWRKVPRYDGYEVSDFGRVRSLRRETPRILRPGTQTKGYQTVALSYLPVGSGMRGHQQSELVHVLVLEAFVGPCPLGMVTSFADADPANCALSNLSWALPAEVSAAMKDRGTALLGEKNPKSKLTEEAVAEIRALLVEGYSGAYLSREFAVSGPTISDIKHRVTWPGVEPAQRPKA